MGYKELLFTVKNSYQQPIKKNTKGTLITTHKNKLCYPSIAD